MPFYIDDFFPRVKHVFCFPYEPFENFVPGGSPSHIHRFIQWMKNSESVMCCACGPAANDISLKNKARRNR